MHRKIINDKLKIKKYQFIDVDYGDHYMFVIVLVVNLGRPLMINTYDYDDINPVENYYLMKMIMSKEFVIAQNATSDSAVLNRSIVQNLYNGGSC